MGYNAGAEVAVSVSRHVAVTAGVRMMSSPATLGVHAELLNADQMFFEIPRERVQAQIGTQPVRLAGGGGPAMSIGVRVR